MIPGTRFDGPERTISKARRDGAYSGSRNGFLLLHKNPGESSFSSLNLVKKALDTRKVGHAGTLDSFARGLLLVLVGRATRLTPWFSGGKKRYRGVIRLGEETDTLDPEGKVTAWGPLPSLESLAGALPRFRGAITQVPPLYSAIHIGGKRAYALAREGEEPELAPRPVHIYGLDIISYEAPLCEIEVCCSRGTYIRSLARDIALAAGSRGSLVSLTRTGIGAFSLEDALNPLDHENPIPVMADALRPVDESALDALGLPCCRVDGKTALGMAHGKPLSALGFAPDPAATSKALGVFTEAGEFVGIVEHKNGSWTYGYVYACK